MQERGGSFEAGESKTARGGDGQPKKGRVTDSGRARGGAGLWGVVYRLEGEDSEAGRKRRERWREIALQSGALRGQCLQRIEARAGTGAPSGARGQASAEAGTGKPEEIELRARVGGQLTATDSKG